MESFIFNDFKRRIIEGEVPLSDTWTLFPVNKSFTAEFDGKLEYIKSSNDLKLFYQTNHTYLRLVNHQYIYHVSHKYILLLM